jgi:hypothetical protein
MLEAYFSLLIKAIELITGERTRLKNQKEGCKELYKLYLLLDKILEDSLNVRRELSDTLREDRHREHVYRSLDSLLRSTGEFTGLLSDLGHSIGIYDESLAEHLANLLGFKYSLIVYLCSHSSLIKEEERKKLLLKVSVNLEKLYSMPYSPSGFFYSPSLGVLYYYSEQQPPEMSALIEKEYIPFDDKRRVAKLLQSADGNIEQLRSSQQHLANFIKKNCRYGDLF